MNMQLMTTKKLRGKKIYRLAINLMTDSKVFRVLLGETSMSKPQTERKQWERYAVA